MAYKKALVEHGNGGWGSALTIAPKEGQVIVCVTAGGAIHPVAQKLSEITGAPVVDGFHHPVKDAQAACAVIDCGGIGRCTVFCRKNIPTINTNAGSPGGPFRSILKDGLYITGVADKNVSAIDE